MLTVTSQRLQNKFGEISDIVQSREPVVITQHGRPTMMLMPYDEQALRQFYAERFIDFLDEQAKNTLPIGDDEFEQLLTMIDEERTVVYQEKMK